MTIVDAPEVNPDALELIADACARYPDGSRRSRASIPGTASESVALLERAFELGFKGLKLHPGDDDRPPGRRGHAAADPRRRGAPRADALPLRRRAAGDSARGLPGREACPEATIILGHMGGYFHVDEAIDVAERHENVVLETSAMPYPARSGGGRRGSAPSGCSTRATALPARPGSRSRRSGSPGSTRRRGAPGVRRERRRGCWRPSGDRRPRVLWRLDLRRSARRRRSTRPGSTARSSAHGEPARLRATTSGNDAVAAEAVRAHPGG